MTENFPLLDQSVIDRLALDVGEKTARMLVESLIVEIESSGRKLETHLSDGDVKLVENQAHALKSAARSFGAMQLGESCLALEEAARASDMQKLGALMKEFKTISDATLQKYCFGEEA